MSNSSLVVYRRLSPNYSSRYGTKIDTITIHHCAGVLSLETIGNIFASGTREASANYGVDNQGRVGQYVDESNRAWTSSNGANDRRAVTIEVANSSTGGQWPVSDKALEGTINLCVDICKRNGIKKLNYTGDTSGNLTMHCWFAATACPGPYLKSKFPYIAQEVNRRLGSDEKPKPVKLDVDGLFGELSTKAMQGWLGTYADGVISDQLTYLKKYWPNLISCEYGDGGSAMVEAFQKFLNKKGYKLEEDGYLGPDTIKAWQEWLKKSKYPCGSDKAGTFGPGTAKAMQNYLNDKVIK